LIDGFVLDLIGSGDLVRLTTLSKDYDGYQAVCSMVNWQFVDRSIRLLRQQLAASGVLTTDDVVHSVPAEMTSWPQNVQILLGHLLYVGCAITDAAPGSGINEIRRPDVAPRI
jgi:hypothetical protein